MYYKLSDKASIRNWPDFGYACFEKGARHPFPLTPKEAEIMLRCDGEHDIETNDIVMSLILRNLIIPCEKGEHSSEWSSLKKYDNRFFPMMNLMITGKCNFNCLHCFNAADNSALMTELSFEEICDLLAQAQNCGINSLQITGGEPMLHKHFLDIMREIYKRDMTVSTLTTNGYFITQKILDELKAMGCRSEMRISFDGIGFHDWMRNFKGAEQKTLDAIKLCIDNGFSVFINTQVHRRNLHTIFKTAQMLNDMGVRIMRIIRTTEVARWVMNAPNASLSLEEYYENMLNFAKEYINSGMNMEIAVWQYLYLSPKTRSFAIVPVKCPNGTYDDNHFSCRSTNYMIAVTSAGEVVPCNQGSGTFMKYGISFGNIHNTPLKEILTSGKFIDTAKMTVGNIRNNSPKCGKCQYFKSCGGGCMILRILLAGHGRDFTHEDITKCHFFNNGWYQKVTQALADYKNLTEIAI
ncbi:MAG: radical SAM protein [Synergistaceae bacterium]|nr:radical SAM protein [Synergistaceae bacterium]